MKYPKFFSIATGGRKPYPYQERFATDDAIPHLLRAPTGAGKTATAILGWLFRRHARPKTTPRRLVYCLPMRVLVEQSVAEAKQWIANLQQEDVFHEAVPVHVLMGGVENKKDAEPWHLHPERPAILIGTQDMLLSRALNRGYAASRFHWPIDFGLLNNDCLWVFDEPQLMAGGVATSAQLAGLREKFGTFNACPSVWMSATLEPTWLDTVDFVGQFPAEPLELEKEDYAPELPLKKRMTAKKTLSPLGVSSSKDMKEPAKQVLAKHESGTQTLVVVNTVERAKAIYAELEKLRKKSETPALLLVHSRFRPHERGPLNKALQSKEPGDRIIVATQVVEAGVDISSRTLVTELAPWPSLVQRMGRCNRTGDDGPGQVFWLDLDEKSYPPYDERDLEDARSYLEKLEDADVSPKALDRFKEREEIALPFEHKHVLRRRDLLDLFDTAPDLSGNDIDIQRFVRSDDPETDVQVFWRLDAPEPKWTSVELRRNQPRREELCNVPIGSFKKEFLEVGKIASRFDSLDGRWQMVAKRDAGTVVPGQVFWVAIDQGGYDIQEGWSPKSGILPETFPLPLPPIPEPIDSSEFDGDDWAHLNWQTIATHTDLVVEELALIASSLGLSEQESSSLHVAARWHDWGKIHAVFQAAIMDEGRHPRAEQALRLNQIKEVVAASRPSEWAGHIDLAKAPDGFWRRYERPRFRHELASALGVLKMQHEGRLPEAWASLSETGRSLALYVLAAHHGKIRLAIRAMPDEKQPPQDVEFACGIWAHDTLSAVDLGGGVVAQSVELSLSPMQMGGEMSWTAEALKLLEEFGPFKLAYLEALLRAADVRASRKEARHDA